MRKFENLYESLQNSAMKYPFKVAIVDDCEAITYKDLLVRVDNSANFMKYQLGLKKEDKIAVLMVNSINMATVFYAAMKIGCTAILINTKLQTKEISAILSGMAIKSFFLNNRWCTKIEEIIKSNTSATVVLDNAKKIAGIDNPKYEFPLMYLSDVKYGKCICEEDKEQVAVIMHTSGTTGKPKGIMITHENILETAYGYAEVQKLNQSAITVLSVPLFHILGLSCVTTFFIYLGGTIIMSEYYDTDKILEQITKYKATHFHTVPTVYYHLVNKINKEIHDLSTLKIAVCGGAPISKQQMFNIHKIAPNAAITLAYGMTETAGSGALSFGHLKPLHHVPNVEIVVVDKNNKEVQKNTIGEIVFRGNVVAKGIFEKQELFYKEMKSGDLGFLDNDNHIFLVGRSKDIINRGGEKIFPATIENIVMEVEGVEQASLIGIDDEEFGEVPVLVVVLKNNRDDIVRNIQKYLKENVAKFETPTEIFVWKEMPLTSNGKISKVKIKEKIKLLKEK